MHVSKIVIPVLLVVALTLSGCTSTTARTVRGDGDVVTEERSVSGVTGVQLATLGDLTIALGDTESLQVEAEENLLPYLETVVQGSELVIRSRPNVSLNPTQPVRYYLTVKGLDALTTSSLGNITAPALQGQARQFSITISSNGSIRLAGLEADGLKVEINSNGDVEIGGGQVDDQDIEITSNGSYLAGDLRCETARVNISSVGNATLWVTEELDATLSSNGNVSYYGSPEVESDITSNGRVIALGEK